jgi:hypothetical protein
VWQAVLAALHHFDEAAARFRMVASSDARKASEQLEDFIAANVRGAPPFSNREQACRQRDDPQPRLALHGAAGCTAHTAKA